MSESFFGIATEVKLPVNCAGVQLAEAGHTRQPRSCWEMRGAMCGTTCTSTSPASLTGTIHPAVRPCGFWLGGEGGRSRRSGTGDGVFLRRNSNNVSRHILLEIYIGAVYVAASARYVTAHFRLIYITPNLAGSWLVVVGEG